jgi:hypothetical protein
MKNIILRLSVIGVLGVVSVDALAQGTPATAPIFITPYSAEKISRTPTIVQSPENATNAIRGNTRTYTRAGRKSSGVAMAENVNPFEGTSFGRIKTEKDYYDRETGGYMNQYDYMGALAQRGETEKMQQIAQYLQQNGVFDPEKFQAAITPAQNDVGQKGAGNTRSTQFAQPQTAQPVFKMKDTTKTVMPQRLHGGYDDANTATQDPADNIPQGRRPIFLR